MNRQRISAIAHRTHPIAAPLNDDNVHQLLARAVPDGPGRVLDLGCGQGHWLARALSGRPELRGTGVDIEEAVIADAARTVAEAGVADRAELIVADANTVSFPESFDLVLAVGAAHAFGGLVPTLAAIRQHLNPRGLVIVGDGFWEREPGAATVDVGFAADEYADLATTVDRIADLGWLPIHGHVSTTEEWDHYEFAWTGALAEWALDHPEDPDSAAALDAAAQHRTEWMHGYRATLGFVTLILRSTGGRSI
jgi:cyclopropane fatty-acyl-phospholipid synthase-like methyltransferase